tara:strand:- start:39 stop:1250 length:1212 start_codon:yes stop_codon:yes gene_type:complete
MVSVTIRDYAEGPLETDGTIRYRKEGDKSSRHTTPIGRKWLHAELSGWPKGVDEIEIICRISGDDDNTGSVGIWKASEDYYCSDAGVGPRVHRSISSSYIELETWKFGNEAKITLHRSPDINEQSLILFSILFRPCLTGTDNTKLEVEVDSKHQGEIIKNLCSKIIEFSETKEDKKKSIYHMQEEFQIFDHYSAYVSNGLGNIVHPKQICTIKGLEHVIKSARDKKLRVVYVGTDTSENLTSVIRWLKSSGNWDKIEKFHVLYTGFWDSEYYDWLPDYHPAKIQNDIIKSDELSQGLIDSLEPSDLVIATFVTPWVVSTENEEKRMYENLLKKTLSKDSYLLSVDPKTVEDSVRSWFTKTTINNDDFYKNKLKLSLDRRVEYLNDSVLWTTWKKDGMKGGESL